MVHSTRSLESLRCVHSSNIPWACRPKLADAHMQLLWRQSHQQFLRRVEHRMFRLLSERRVCGREKCDARSAMWWCERRGVQGKKARSAVNVQSRSTLLAASASEASQPQTSLNTREQHLQLHVAANARWLARSVARHAPRLTCSPQAQACAGGAIKRPRHAREHALAATNNYQSKTSTTRTFPHMTPRK